MYPISLCVTFIRNFSVKTSAVTLLDEEYIELAPKLYKNEARQVSVVLVVLQSLLFPRVQFHVRVPCRKRFNRSHVCGGPAVLVFRVSVFVFLCVPVVSVSVCLYDAAYLYPQFEEQVAVTHCQKSVEQNRKEHKETVTALRSFVSHDLCVIVVKFEHMIK